MAALILALFTSGLAAINTIWLGPWSSKHQDVVLNDAKANPSLAALGGGQFKSSNDGNSALLLAMWRVKSLTVCFGTIAPER